MRRVGAMLLFCAVVAGPEALAQRRQRQRPVRPPTGAPGPVLVAPPTVSATTGAANQPRPTFDPAEVIPVPVAGVDGMLRRMRVYLLLPPPGTTAFPVRSGALGRRLWVLLPSCQQTNPHDHRDPCPVDRVAFEAVGQGDVNGTDPTMLGTSPESRRLQSFLIGDTVPRVRIKVFGPNARLRYEAVIETTRLVDLPPPQGTATPTGYDFDYLQFPAR